jgi:uncharacterized protein involved in exopolysaccharide biosynthesis
MDGINLKRGVQMQEYEVDLRNYINAALKRKKLVICTFLICVVTIAIAIVIMPKTYQSTALIMITPSRVESALSPSTVSLSLEQWNAGKYTDSRPAISLVTHRKLLISNLVLERVISKLHLTNNKGEVLPYEDLLKKLNVIEKRETKESNIIELKARDKNPYIAKDIANTWAQVYVEYNQELILGEVKGTGEFITDQFEIVKQNLIKAEEKVKDFKEEHALDLMQSELDMKKSKLADYRKELIDSEIKLRTKEDILSQLKNQIKEQEKFTVVSKAMTDDALWQLASKERNAGGADKRALKSEIINPVYQNLELRIVNTEVEVNTLKPGLKYLNDSIVVFQQEIAVLKSSVLQGEFDLAQLNRQVNIYKKTYDNLSDKIEEARMIKAAQLGEVKIVSPAISSHYPAGPRKMLTLVVAGIFSLILSVFLAVFTEYWQRD